MGGLKLVRYSMLPATTPMSKRCLYCQRRLMPSTRTLPSFSRSLQDTHAPKSALKAACPCHSPRFRTGSLQQGASPALSSQGMSGGQEA